MRQENREELGSKCAATRLTNEQPRVQKDLEWKLREYAGNRGTLRRTYGG
jgi:hypothetical protein